MAIDEYIKMMLSNLALFTIWIYFLITVVPTLSMSMPNWSSPTFATWIIISSRHGMLIVCCAHVLLFLSMPQLPAGKSKLMRRNIRRWLTLYFSYFLRTNIMTIDADLSDQRQQSSHFGRIGCRSWNPSCSSPSEEARGHTSSYRFIISRQ